MRSPLLRKAAFLMYYSVGLFLELSTPFAYFSVLVPITTLPSLLLLVNTFNSQ